MGSDEWIITKGYKWTEGCGFTSHHDYIKNPVECKAKCIEWSVKFESCTAFNSCLGPGSPCTLCLGSGEDIPDAPSTRDESCTAYRLDIPEPKPTSVNGWPGWVQKKGYTVKEKSCSWEIWSTDYTLKSCKFECDKHTECQAFEFGNAVKLNHYDNTEYRNIECRVFYDCTQNPPELKCSR